MIVYIFRSACGFFPLELNDDEQAIANRKPDTIVIETPEGRVVWSKGGSQPIQVATNKIETVYLNPMQSKKLSFLVDRGSALIGVKLFLEIPGGAKCTIDEYGRVEWNKSNPETKPAKTIDQPILMSCKVTTARKMATQLKNALCALRAIEEIVGDDFCEDLASREAIHPEQVTGDLKMCNDKIGLVYQIAHAEIPDHSCHDSHDGWRLLKHDVLKQEKPVDSPTPPCNPL